MIHKTAIIDIKSKIDQNVEIGPYTVVGPDGVAFTATAKLKRMG